jgi:hypothetical protein
MLGNYIIIVLMLITLSGCATTSDPREGGLFGGIKGITSGAYDDRIRQRQMQLAQQQETNIELREKSQVLERQVQLRHQELVAEQKRLVKLQDDLSQLESEVSALTAKSDRQKQDISALKQKTVKLRQRIATQKTNLADLDRAGGPQAAPERYKMLKNERDRLTDEYRNLLEYFKRLSEATS